jgi:hypothetical protein
MLDYADYIGLAGSNLALIRQSCWDATKHAFDLLAEKIKTQDGRDELMHDLKFVD